jgi:hypothetical protein
MLQCKRAGHRFSSSSSEERETGSEFFCNSAPPPTCKIKRSQVNATLQPHDNFEVSYTPFCWSLEPGPGEKDHPVECSKLPGGAIVMPNGRALQFCVRVANMRASGRGGTVRGAALFVDG